MSAFSEPSIIINGQNLTTAEAMTVRVALVSFALDLQQNGLGNDEHGTAMTKGYLAAIGMVCKYMALTRPRAQEEGK